MAAEEVLDSTKVFFLSTFDMVVLSALLLGAGFFLFKKRKEAKTDNTVTSFSIIPTPASNDLSGDNFVSKMKKSGRNVVVFYGSQTGTAEEFAGRLAKEAARYGLKGMVADPEECEMEDLGQLSEIDNSLAIFCMATYGEGDPTDNAQSFYEFLNSGQADLSGLNYTVFGLGNKTYEHYNAMGIFVDKKLAELGATRIFELGEGDDDGNLEEDFISWKERFWPSVCEHFGLHSTGVEVNMRQYKLVIPTDVAEDRIYTGEVTRLGSFKSQRPPFDAKNPFLAAITANRELHKGGDRSCMHIEIDVSDSRIRYEAGDHVAVYPINDADKVNRIGELLDENLDQVISLVSLDSDSHRKNPFPCPCSYRTALTYYLDISCTPYTHVLKEIADYASNSEEKQMLKTMGSSTPEGKLLYHEWVIDNCRNIVDILEDLPSLKPPLDHLCELLPRLQARYYSISSSPKVYPNTIHVTAVLIKYETPTKRTRLGVATGWLANKKPDNGNLPKVPVFVRKSQFRLPAQVQTPVILIGPGTGFAPFRGFIQERNFLKAQGKPVGETILYFGCRKHSEDFIYEDELNKYLEDGILTKLYTAYSRDKDEKVYVTHLLRQNATEVWKVINPQSMGHIYVCGDAKNMARDVHNIIKEICIQQGEMTESQAVDFVKKMEFQKRYSADVWS
ncbi:hypothetical protein CHUAL_001042 [Chamberlinius hualienensis]